MILKYLALNCQRSANFIHIYMFLLDCTRLLLQWEKGDLIPLVFLEAMQTAAAAASIVPATYRMAAIDKQDAIKTALTENNFKPDYALLYETRLQHELAKQITERDVLETSIASTHARATAIDLEAVAAVAQTTKAASAWYNDEMQAKFDADPAAFERIAEIAFNVNARRGPLQIGAECILLRQGSQSEPVKVRVDSAPDPQTGLVRIKEWYEENYVVKPFFAGYKTDGTALRGELSGGSAPLRQKVPEDATTAPEQFAALNAMANNSLPSFKALLIGIVAQINEKHGANVVALAGGGLKSVISASRKCFNEYNGAFTSVLDFLRFTIQCEEPAHVVDVLEAVEAEAALTMLRLKNRLEMRDETGDGYRDTLANIEHNKFIAELQVTLASMQAKKKEVHGAYRVDRVCTLPQNHLGAASQDAVERLAAGATRDFNISGTTITGGQLMALCSGLGQPTIRLTELKMNACQGLDGVNLAETILTPKVCTALGPGIRNISLTSTGVAGQVAPVIANLARAGCGKGLKFLELGGNNLSGELPGGLFGGGASDDAALGGPHQHPVKGGRGWVAAPAIGTSPSSTIHIAEKEKDPDYAGSLWLHFKKLKWLLLWENNITGKIPDELGACTKMENLFLSENQMEGPLPSSLSSLVELDGLILSQNNFTGAVPEEWSSMVLLEKLHLDHCATGRFSRNDLGPRMKVFVESNAAVLQYHC